MALLAGWPLGAAASAAGSTGSSTTAAAATSTSTSTTSTTNPSATTSTTRPPTSSTTSTTTVPPPAKVPVGVTDGQSIQTLLSNAIALTSVGVDDTALQTAIAATQLKLDRDAVTARQATLNAARASDEAANAIALASRAQASYRSLDGALKKAVLFLYTDGPAALTVNPAAGDTLAYAADYADTAINPNGLLSTRRFDAETAKGALADAQKAEQAASQAAAKAKAAQGAEQTELNQLAIELRGSRRSAGQPGSGGPRQPGDPGGQRAGFGIGPAVHARVRHPAPAGDHGGRLGLGLRRARQTLRVGCHRAQLVRLLRLDAVRMATGGRIHPPSGRRPVRLDDSGSSLTAPAGRPGVLRHNRHPPRGDLHRRRPDDQCAPHRRRGSS